MNKLNFLRLNVLAIFFLMMSCGRPIAKFEMANPAQNNQTVVELVAPASVKFKNKTEKGKTFEWNFGDNSAVARDSSPTHVFKNSGNYSVVLTVNGKSKTTQIVHVKAPSECTVEIETEFGTMLAVLYAATPKHRDNFTKLADENFFNDLLFHRVIEGFMIQGGDPDSRNARPEAGLGMGGPGYQIPAEFVDSLTHVRGALAAARTGNPKKESSGSQFYIVHGKPVTAQQLDMFEAQKGIKYSAETRKKYLEIGGTPFLDKEYTVFGHLVTGFDVLEKIAATPTGAANRPKSDMKMKIRVVR
ncbi:MAG: hypothetical protein RL757_1362 [Bacteroidota bacterium]|jgi:peptidyl-prolyl cis-trans isomerase B (cyclophilin B)